MKRFLIMMAILVVLGVAFAASYVTEIEGPWMIHNFYSDYSYLVPTDTVGTAAEGAFYADDSENCIKYYNGSSWIALTTGSGDNTLNDAYDQGGAGSGRTITATDGAVLITSTDADTAYMLDLYPVPGSSAALGGVYVRPGANSTAGAVVVNNSGSGPDFYGTGGVFQVSKLGAAVCLTLDPTDDISLDNGKAIKSDTTDAHTAKIKVYDVDGTAYVDALTVTNGNSPTMSLGNNAVTISIDSTDWDVSATGAQTGMASIGFDSGTILYCDTVELSNSDIKGLRASPKVLVAAPGTNKFIEFVSAVLVLDYGSNILTESTDNMVIEYTTSGVDTTAAIEATNFIDASADTILFVPVSFPAYTAASDMVNKSLQLTNTGDGEYAGNAGEDTTITVKITYKIHSDGL